MSSKRDTIAGAERRPTQPPVLHDDITLNFHYFAASRGGEIMKMSVPLLLSFLILCSVLDPSGASAVPSEATLFPDSARIVDVSRVTLQPAGETFKAVVVLPGQAVPESLSASLPSGSPLRIEDQNRRQINRQDDARIAELRRQIQNAKTEKIVIVAGIQALDAQIQFWQAQAKGRAKTLEEAVALSALLSKNVKKAFQEKLALEPDLQKTDSRIKELQEELNRITGQKESLWEVTFLISGPPARETILTLTYTLGGCGWSPLYRLEALPRDGTILFDWEAEIWQSSGIDWKQINTNIATLPPRSAIAPPSLPPWIIRPRQPIPLKGRAKTDLLEASPAAVEAKMFSDPPEAAEPHEIRKSTYSLWNLGKRNIPAGARQRIKIRAESWPADFVHLLRPALTSQAFVQAAVKLSETKDIPSGQASFLIDGALLARRPFSFAGTEGTLSFGVDPLVTAEAIPLSRKSGEKGFISDRQTHEWVWRYDVSNTRDSAVRVRLEDSLPQLRDERIRLSLKLEPEPSEKKVDTLIWLMELPTGQKTSLTSMIRIDAPKELDLDLGWRRF
jgi:uncharacterized protein (TIGR02231 family)